MSGLSAGIGRVGEGRPRPRTSPRRRRRRCRRPADRCRCRSRRRSCRCWFRPRRAVRRRRCRDRWDWSRCRLAPTQVPVLLSTPSFSSVAVGVVVGRVGRRARSGAGDFGAVLERVAVAVGVVRVGAELVFLPVGQAVAGAAVFEVVAGIQGGGRGRSGVRQFVVVRHAVAVGVDHHEGEDGPGDRGAGRERRRGRNRPASSRCRPRGR